MRARLLEDEQVLERLVRPVDLQHVLRLAVHQVTAGVQLQRAEVWVAGAEPSLEEGRRVAGRRALLTGSAQAGRVPTGLTGVAGSKISRVALFLAMT